MPKVRAAAFGLTVPWFWGTHQPTYPDSFGLCFAEPVRRLAKVGAPALPSSSLVVIHGRIQSSNPSLTRPGDSRWGCFCSGLASSAGSVMLGRLRSQQAYGTFNETWAGVVAVMGQTCVSLEPQRPLGTRTLFDRQDEAMSALRVTDFLMVIGEELR